MLPPPDLQMRRAALEQGGPGNSQKKVLSNPESVTSPLDFQVCRLRRIYCFRHATARTIATLAYGVAR
jgi:hypothetical protein